MVRPPVGGRWIVRRVGEQDRRGAVDSCAVRRVGQRDGPVDAADEPGPRLAGAVGVRGGGAGEEGWGYEGGGGGGARAGEQRCGYEVVEAADEPRVVDAIHGESRERPVPRAAHE